MTASHPTEARAHVASVTLAAEDPDALAKFYRETLGLADLTGASDEIVLGAGGRALLRLRQATAPRPEGRRRPGLFHAAFLLPDRGALGAWLRSALDRRLPLLGASDHGVSEALYLADPEGNGIEVYADRPSALWHDEGGRLAMPSDPLDLDALSASGKAWDGAPDGTMVGHVHLSVPDLPAAEAHATEALGLAVTARHPGATFLSWDGYHHHLALNRWGMAGAAGRIAPGAPGLVRVELAGTVTATTDPMGLRYVPAASQGA